MLNLLKKRGLAILSNQVDHVRSIEAEIDELKQKQYNTNICGVFLTFENHKDVTLAKALAQQVTQIFESNTQMKRAQEPDQYIWESMSYTKKQ